MSTKIKTIAKLTTDNEAETPMSWLLKANLYINVVVVSVVYPGPPPVITQIIGNWLKTLIRLITEAMNKLFLKSGRVIEK